MRRERRQRQVAGSPQRRDADLAWAAGFFDGEGTVRLESKGCHVLRVANTHRPSLERLLALFGGSIGPGNSNAAAKFRRVYRWSVCGSGAREAMRRLAPLLFEKREQVDVALSIQPVKGRLSEQERARRAEAMRHLAALKRVR